MFPFWEVAIAPVLEAAGATKVVEIGALRGETTVLMLDAARPRRRAARHRPGAPSSTRPSTSAASPAGTSSTATSASTSSRRWPRWTPPSSTATTTGTPSTTSSSCSPHVLGQRGRAAAGADPARRLLALRPARPLLRARADPRRVPPALRPAGHVARAQGPGSRRRAQPHPVQRRRRGRAAQRRDDRARRLHRRARRAAAPRRAPRSTSGSRSSSRRSGSRASPSWPGCSTGSRAIEGRDALLELSEETRHQSLLFQHNVFYTRERQLRAGADALPRPAEGRRCSTSTTSRTRSASTTSLLCLEHGRPLDPRKLRDPVRNLKDRLVLIRRSREHGGDRDGGETGAGYFPYTAMGRARLDAPPGPPRRDPRGAGRRRPRRVRHRPRRRRHLPARLPRGPRHGAAHGLGGRPLQAARAKSSRSEASSATPAWLRRVRRGRLLAPVPGGWGGLRSLLADLNIVRDGFARFDLLDDRVRFLQGASARRWPRRPIEKVALLRIGPAPGAQAADGPRAALRPGHGRRARHRRRLRRPRVPQAVDAFRAEARASPTRSSGSTTGVPTGASWARPATSRRSPRSTTSTCPRTSPVTSRRTWRSPRPAPRRPWAPPARTCRSSSSSTTCGARPRARCTRCRRAYQRGHRRPRLRGASSSRTARAPTSASASEFVRSFGPEFRYLDLGDDAPPLAGARAQPRHRRVHGRRTSRS